MVSTGAANTLVHAATRVSWFSNLIGELAFLDGYSQFAVSAEALEDLEQVIAKNSSWPATFDSISRL